MTFRVGMFVLALTAIAMLLALRLACEGYLYTALVLVLIGMTLCVGVLFSVVRGRHW